MANDDFNSGRRGGHAGSDTDMDAFRAGQNALRIDQGNEASAKKSYWPKGDGGGGGALLIPLLLLGPLIFHAAIVALVLPWLLRLTLKLPVGQPPLTWGQLYKACFFITLAAGLVGLGAGVATAGVLSPMGLFAGALALKLHRKDLFSGTGAYWRAFRSSWLVSVAAMLVYLAFISILFLVASG